MSSKKFLLGAVVLAALGAVGMFGAVVSADHSWGGYHWARSANPLALSLGDNVSAVWDGSLALASSDWNVSEVLDTVVVAGGTNATKGKNTPKNCVPTLGRAEICSAKYGYNGWLGVAQIWASGDHIVQSTVKLNDTYFSTAKYNKPEWRNFVMCQEIGHAFGLDHQDENFSNPNLGTCMDYTSDPSTNQHPNQHDYDQLEAIYAHLDAATSAPAAVAGASGVVPPGHAVAEWGTAIRHSADGKPSRYVRDLGNGNKIFTFVIWAR